MPIVGVKDQENIQSRYEGPWPPRGLKKLRTGKPQTRKAPTPGSKTQRRKQNRK